MSKTTDIMESTTAQENKQNMQTNSDTIIYPFSANPNLEENDLHGLDVYKRYLESAFGNARIHDIAIVGRFGIGKSSIIQSFESQYLKKNRKSDNKFLYITLGNYKSKEQDLEEGRKCDENEVQANNNHDAESEQSVIERRVILQIYTRFRRKSIPESSFNLIQEHNILNKISVSVCMLLTICICLYLYPSIKELELPGNIEQPIDGNIVYFVFSILAVVFASIICFNSVKQLILRWRLKEATIKLAGTIEAKCEQKSCEGYIDQHTTEILYCLERIAEQISYTIVFEDMDRLNPDICVNVLMRLKELNYMINTRLRHENGKNASGVQMRFIYVVNDEIIQRLQKTKFADYVLSVFPRLNMRSAPVVFAEKLKIIDKEICTEMNWNDDIFDEDKGKLISIIAKYISDYRIYYAILNDYSLLLRLYINNSNGNKIPERFNRISNRILAFAVYKNACPDDYCRIWADRSDVFPKYHRDRIAHENVNLIDELIGIEEENGYLSIDCLYYAGFPEDTIVGYVVDMLEMDAYHVLFPNPSIDSVLIEMALVKLLEDSTSSDSNNFTITSDIKNEYKRLQCIRSILIYMLKNNIQSDYNWIINERNSYIGFMDVIDCEQIDAKMQRKMYEQFGFDWSSNKCIFDMFSHDDKLVSLIPLTDSKIYIYIRGCGVKFNPNYPLHTIDGSDKEIPLLIKELMNKEL